MTNPSDASENTKKTIHELSKEFPNKTYRELEKIRDARRKLEEQIEKTALQKARESGL